MAMGYSKEAANYLHVVDECHVSLQPMEMMRK